MALTYKIFVLHDKLSNEKYSLTSIFFKGFYFKIILFYGKILVLNHAIYSILS